MPNSSSSCPSSHRSRGIHDQQLMMRMSCRIVISSWGCQLRMRQNFTSMSVRDGMQTDRRHWPVSHLMSRSRVRVFFSVKMSSSHNQNRRRISFKVYTTTHRQKKLPATSPYQNRRCLKLMVKALRRKRFRFIPTMFSLRLQTSIGNAKMAIVVDR